LKKLKYYVLPASLKGRASDDMPSNWWF